MKLTKAHLESLVVQKTFTRPTPTMTICVITVPGNAQVAGESNVIDPANFDAAIGEKMAYEDAIEKLWQLEGYAIKRQSSTVLSRAARAGYQAERAAQVEADGREPAPDWANLSEPAARLALEDARAVFGGNAPEHHGPVFRAAVLAFT
ncbi:MULTISPECIES: Gp49 family protein [unclassified Mameliella]|uniref:Gp49 family protein n=1 Tax=Mameliella sp. LZ-28 TaxID=2484146 RepID=UPI00143F8591|nr:Gp49 family protein [Mameliella sp. LZ-28]MCR9276244.1 Gp49 family protein [Paracoccaceae bacterium]